MNDALRRSLSSLCLPIAPKEQDFAASALEKFFETKGIPPSDYSSWVKLQLGLWEDDGQPSKILKEAMSAIFATINDTQYRLDSKNYFNIHNKLKENFRFSHSEATAFLSHIRVARDLAVNNLLSSARLTYILRNLDGRIHFSSQNVTMALNKLGYKTKVTRGTLEALFQSDKENELSLFADADLVVGAELLGSNAKLFGYRGDLCNDLLFLAPEPNNVKYIAHLQVLHFQCCLLESFDHSMFDLYEFNPRSADADWLFDAYPENLIKAGNPFLNNAKSVSILDRNWVESKDNLRPGALSLFNILSSLDELSYAARREVAMQIRAWIFLFFRLSNDQPTALPEHLARDSFFDLAQLIADGNTKTYGILEQRAVDALASLLFTKNTWRARGLSDSVNATNLSKKKLGDCDFQDSTNLKIEAFESHGGTLTDIYVQDHIRTLKKVIPLRVAELTSVANVKDWTATVTFVAQHVECAVPSNMSIADLSVNFKIETLSTFSSRAAKHFQADVVRQYFLGPLREKRTPESVRQKLRTLLSS